jgi:hypothetical protein
MKEITELYVTIGSRSIECTNVMHGSSLAYVAWFDTAGSTFKLKVYRSYHASTRGRNIGGSMLMHVWMPILMPCVVLELIVLNSTSD